MTVDLTNAAVGGNFCFSTAALTGISGAATTYSSGSLAIQYAVNGKMQTAKTQVSGGATPTTDVNTTVAFLPQAINTVCCYVWGLNAAGTVLVAQGKITAWTDTRA